MSVARRVWRSLDYKGQIFILLVVLSFIGVCSPMIFGKFVTSLETEDGCALLHLGLFGFCEVLGIILDYVRLRCVSVSIARAEDELRQVAFERMLKLPMDKIFTDSKGTWIGRICNDTSAICGALQGFWTQLASFAVFLVVASAFIFSRVPILMALFILVMLVGALTYKVFKRALGRAAMKSRKTCYRFFDYAFDACGLLPIICTHGCDAAFAHRFAKMSTAYANREAKSRKTSEQFATFYGLEVLALHIMVLGLCLVVYQMGMIRVGEVVAYDMMLMKLVSGINGLMQQLPTFERGRECARSFGEWTDCWDNENLPQQKKDESNLFNNSTAIMLDNVSYAYPGCTVNVLRRVSLRINKGEYVGLIGRNGSGKSTLIGIILGILNPIEGLCLNALTTISFVPQVATLFKGSILENVRLFSSSITKMQVAHTLENCGLGEWLAKQVCGLDTMIDGDHLSGGEKQRLCIARALVRMPSLLIADEITNNLDLIEKRRIMKILKSLKGQCTVISITHDEDWLADCDKTYLVQDGQCTEYQLN